MSFYDLTKEGVLRPKALFGYRLKRDRSIPSKGGQKEFEPDGSWLQKKRLETFLEERTTVLSERRVEKLKNVVEGIWDNDKRLVNLKRPGKFWMHMGFTDERRNWLYPEEALFLMETNTLELYHENRPMSIQEAYCKLLGSGMCLEEYQVFAHLRRLGFVVLRHEEERVFTDYERQINLNEYIDKKKRKDKLKKGKGKSNKKISQHDNTVHDAAKHKTDDCLESINDSNTSNSNQPENLELKNLDNANETNSSIKRNLENDDSDSDCNKKLKCNNNDTDTTIFDSVIDSSSDDTDNLFYNISTWSSCFKTQNSNSLKENCGEMHQAQSVSDSEDVDLLPDVSKRKATITLPPSHLLPSGVEVSAIDIDSISEQLKTSIQNKVFETKIQKEDFKEKKFSCFERIDQNSTKIKANSWSEYKCKKAERLAETTSSTLVDHLWNDTVKPLIRPTEISSYKEVIDRLQIIQSANLESLEPDVSNLLNLPKVSFDVHLPDHRFKKTMPGLPNHRVCVSRCDGLPPGLNAIQHFCNKYQDNVPLHWAVVDSGEIAFYVFDNSRAVEVLTD